MSHQTTVHGGVFIKNSPGPYVLGTVRRGTRALVYERLSAKALRLRWRRLAADGLGSDRSSKLEPWNAHNQGP